MSYLLEADERPVEVALGGLQNSQVGAAAGKAAVTPTGEIVPRLGRVLLDPCGDDRGGRRRWMRRIREHVNVYRKGPQSGTESSNTNKKTGPEHTPPPPQPSRTETEKVKSAEAHAALHAATVARRLVELHRLCVVLGHPGWLADGDEHWDQVSKGVRVQQAWTAHGQCHGPPLGPSSNVALRTQTHSRQGAPYRPECRRRPG